MISPPTAGDLADRGTRRTVVTFHSSLASQGRHHDRACQAEVARRLAALMGCEHGGELAPDVPIDRPLYLVPSAPLLVEEGRRLGVTSEADLFGALIPFPFVATKAISHPLVRPGAASVEGWSDDLAAELPDLVLAGFTAFSPDDALAAGSRLLEKGPVRLKPVEASAGAGQSVVTGRDVLAAQIAAQDEATIARTGLVLEEDLSDVTTFAVGETRAAGQLLGYFGTQQLTRNRRGAEAYGGSTLRFVRGGMAALDELDLAPNERQAVAQARGFDAAVSAAWPSLCISRRNYDVAQGIDASGRFRSGVLEQSWRIGGATPAEIAALELFAAEPARTIVRARTVERYGPAELPDGACIYFQGVDERAGALTKYVLAEP